MRRHPEQAAIITSERIKIAKRVGTSNTSELEQSCSLNSNISVENSNDVDFASKRRKKTSSSTIQIEMDKNKLLDACVQLVTVDGRPLSILEDSGMRQILDPIVRSLGNEKPFSINRENVLKEIHAEATQIRNLIKSEVRGRLISIKVDTATRMDRAILGINAQYCIDGKLVLRNLCVKEIYTKHTATNLEKEINEVLTNFDISPQQIYSITTDNAANMLKTIRLLSDQVDVDFREQESDDEDNNEDFLDPTSNTILFEENEDWAINTCSFFPSISNKQGIIGLRCAAHTLQLSVLDALKDLETTRVINKARTLCRKLRSPTITLILIRLGRRKPVLDCPTRWHSTLDMVDSLLILKDVSHDIISDDQGLLENEWDILKIISEALTPAKIATKKLQGEQLLVGDFFESWLRCKFSVKAVGSSLAQCLYECMERREKLLFNNTAILSAIYMDPRWHIMLTETQRAAAETHMLSVWHRLEVLQPSEPNNSNQNQINIQNLIDVIEPNESLVMDPIEKLLLRRESVISAEQTSLTKRDIKKIINEVTRIQRLPRSENILKYWEKRRYSDPYLYQLAITVLSVPVTQVSVERIFSHLKFILNYLRSRLRSNVVNDILFVRCNKIFQKNELS